MKGTGDETWDGSEMALLRVTGLSGQDGIWPVQGSFSSSLLEIYQCGSKGERLEMKIITIKVEAKLRQRKALKSQVVPTFIPGTLKELAPGSTGSVTSAAFTGGLGGKDISEIDAKWEII